MKQMLLLWELQRCETILEKIKEKASLDSIERKMKKTKAEYYRLRKKLNKLIEEYKEGENTINKNNRQCKSLYFELKEIEEGIYNGSINDIKIYHKKEEKVRTLKEKIQNIEDQSLEKMERKEEIQKEILKIKKTLKNIQEIYKETKESYTEEIENIEKQQQELQCKIQEFQEKIEKTFLDTYKDLKKSIQPVLAKVNKEICTGCNMEISIIRLKNIYEDDSIHKCENCGRILYIENIS